MQKLIRMLDLIATLRAQRSVLTAADLARRLDTSTRTIYRDIAALQAMGVPIDGAAGLGYILRPGFHLPPLNFTPDEAEAITVGLALLSRTGDRGLTEAAASVAAKIAAVQPRRDGAAPAALLASPWHDLPEAATPTALLRRAVREERALRISYRDAAGRDSDRTVLPLALIYYVEATILAAFCELRQEFRHFRQDRILCAEITRTSFRTSAASLRRDWAAQHPAYWQEANSSRKPLDNPRTSG